MLKILLKQFIQRTGRKPNSLEMLQLKFKAAEQAGKGKVIEFPKDKITDWTKSQSRPPETEIIGGIQTTRGLGDVFPKQVEKTVTVRTVIEDIKKLEPIESMKETNKVLKGEGKYKNLSKADREKIAGDESVTDHIFERNIEPDPEDFAYGGVAGLLGERTGYIHGGITHSDGRRGFFTGAQAATRGPAGGQAMSPGTSTTGGTRHGGGGGGGGTTTQPDRPIHHPDLDTTYVSTPVNGFDALSTISFVEAAA